MSTNLFSPDEKVILADSPLSARMRPRSLEEFIGQKHILGEGKLLTRAIEADRISSLMISPFVKVDMRSLMSSEL